MKPNLLPLTAAMVAIVLFADTGRSQSNLPPAILSQPQNALATNDATVSFSIRVSGTQPLQIRWQFNGVNLTNSQKVLDATATTVFLEQLAPSNAGPYDVVITNAWGSVTSSVATLTLGFAPVITLQPANQVYPGNNPVTFSVTATGSGPLTYQWVYNSRTFLPNSLISTVAGTNAGRFSGDGGPATNATFSHPYGVAVDEDGDLFIADTYNQRIRKVNTSGIITTVAGNGSSGYNGNGNVATNSSLYQPLGVTVDADDNLFIADTYNQRVRVDTYNILVTVAGNGQTGHTGDGGAASNASLNQPSSVALDAAGNIYIADTENSRIRKVDINDTITTLAGNGTNGYAGDGGAATNCELYYPSGVAVDASGDVIIADFDNNRIRMVSTNGIITTVAGRAGSGFSGDGGAATNALLAHPMGVTVDNSGNIFIADAYNNRIREVTADGIIKTVAGDSYVIPLGDGGAATNASLNEPSGVAVDAAGDLFIADTENNRIRKVTAAGPVLTVNNPGQTNAGNYQVIVANAFGSVTSSVATLTVDLPPVITRQPASGSVVVGGTAAFSVAVIGPAPLTWQWQFNGVNLTDGDAISGSATAILTFSQATTNNGGSYDVVVSDAFGSVTSSVAMLTITFPPTITNQPVSQTVINGGSTTFSVGATGTPPFSYQWLFNGTNLPDGLITTVAGSGSLSSPDGVAVDASGNIFIADSQNERIYKVDTNGIITTVAGTGVAGYGGDGGAATNAELYAPFGVAVDNAGNVFFSDSANNRVRKVDANGIITTVAGDGSQAFAGDGGAATNAALAEPSGLALDGGGNLFIADAGNYRVRKVDTNGLISTVVGDGTIGYSGDGNAATNATLSYVTGVAVDAAGNLFVVDQGDDRIRRVATNNIISTVAGNGGYAYAGDGGLATNASISNPYGVAVDAYGDVFIADTSHDVIRKVDPSGYISTVAGDGFVGYTGDGGPAIDATLDIPYAVATDPAGNLFIADAQNAAIRKVVLATSHSILTLNNVTTNNAGTYQVIVYNPWGSATSSNVTLNVAFPPAIANQPVNQTIINGSNAVFSVGATGTGPLAYQWLFDGTNLTDGGEFSGSATANLALSPSTAVDAGLYDVIITNSWGSVTSSVVTLAIAYPPAITSQPVSQTVVNGSNALFSVSATGTAPLSYQWQFDGTNLTDEGDISGSATTNLVLTEVASANAGLYDVVITNLWGSVTSSIAPLTIAYPPVITGQPVSQTIVSGNNALFSVSATGTAPLIYQWQLDGTNLVDEGNVSGSASSALTLTQISDANAGLYDVIITNAGGSVTSSVVTLIVGHYPAITNGLVSVTSPGGSNVVFSVGVTGTAPLGYEWIFNSTFLPNGIITTVAGSGTIGFFGDGGVATNASLNQPYAVAADGQGNQFIADRINERIRKVDVHGIITTVAGNGENGYKGDGGAATNASLTNPLGVAVDATGNLFIADSVNARIRRVDTNGLITTVAGNGASGYAGDGGAATNASLGLPSDVAVDAAGNLFIADQANRRIRRVDTNGLITTVAGNGSAGFTGDGGAATNTSLNVPTGVTVDASGNLFIADSANQRIRKVDVNGLITTVAGNGTNGFSGDGGAASAASLSNPIRVAVDASGNLFIADLNNQRVRKVDTAGSISTLAGKGSYGYSGDGGAATNATLESPYGVATDPYGNVFIADSSNERIRKVALLGPKLAVYDVGYANAGNYEVIINNAYGTAYSGVAVLTVTLPPLITEQPANQNVIIGYNATFQATALGSALHYQWQFNGTNLEQGHFYSANNPTLTLYDTTAAAAGNYDVVVTNAWGSVTSSVAALTIIYPPTITSEPASQMVTNGSAVLFTVGVGGTGPFTYQWLLNGANLPNNIITTVAGNGTNRYSGDGGPATNASLNIPGGVAVDSAGNLFIADSDNQRIRKVNTGGIITTVAGTGTAGLSGNGLVATNSSLSNPQGVAVDADDNLLIADTGNNRIRVDTYDILITVAGGGQGPDGGPAVNAALNQPQAVAVDDDGNIFIADREDNRIRKVDVNDIITTVAGKGIEGYTGDGGVATNAELNNPYGVAVDANGNVYVADTENERVRKVGVNGTITTVAGTGVAGYSGDGGAATNATLHFPYGLATDASGNLFIADYYNQRIRKVDANGIITTVAGNGTNYSNHSQSFVGDGGPATNAYLFDPYGVAVDGAGDLYIADTYNFRIRKVTPQGPVLTVAGASLANAGNYQVIITSAAGSVTSSVATLTVEIGPSITQQPLSQSVIAGSLATFNVTASGPSPLAYQWQFNGTNQLPGTNPNLVVYPATPANAGLYEVVITNLYGSVTSSIVTLTVNTPQISAVNIANGSVTLTLLTAPNLSSEVWMTTNLSPPVVWQSIYTNLAGTNGIWQFTDTNASQYPVRFYRTSTP